MSLRAAIRALGAHDADMAASELSMLLVMSDPANPARALALHLLALIEFDRGQAEGARGLLDESADIERSAGCEDVAQRTVHQLALVTQPGASVASVGHYYQETYGALAKMRNAQGMGLCLKAMAEICLLRGKRDEALTMLRRSSQLLASQDAPAAQHVGTWIRALES